MASSLKSFLPVGLAVLCALSSIGLGAEEEDEVISLSPVKREEAKETPTEAPTDAPTATAAVVVATPTPAPTPPPTPTFTPNPTLRPTPAKKLALIEELGFRQDEAGVHINIQANRRLQGRARVLKNPDRILVAFPGAMLAKRTLSREINLGAAVRARLAQHPGDEVWLVVDLLEPVPYRVHPAAAWGYGLTLETGSAPKPLPPRRIADLPRINLMFFDLNVLYQGKQYDRFPCANFIYDKSDAFPLKREFLTTLVFHQGYGAFVGNLRLVDPKGEVLDHTKEPIAFNLFSELFDYSVEVPWKVEFPSKGFYTLILTLNGEDVLQHRFYVGHNDDKPSRSAK